MQSDEGELTLAIFRKLTSQILPFYCHMISYMSFESLSCTEHHGGKKVAGTKDEQVMAITIKRCMQKQKRMIFMCLQLLLGGWFYEVV